MTKKLFLSQNIDKKELDKYLTPNKLGGKDPKTHFIRSIEIKNNDSNIEGFTSLKQLPLQTLDYIINFLSYSYFRKLAFNFFVFDKKKFNNKKIKENLLNTFKEDKNKWDLSKNQCKIISISEFEKGVLISFSFSDGEKTYLDIDQDYKIVNKLMINGVYISSNGFMSFIGIKKSFINKQILEIISSKILNTKFSSIKFHELHFEKFYNNLDQITKSGQFDVINGEKVKNSITRAESKTNLKNFIKVGDFADLRGYLLEKRFKDINILMSKSKTFPNYSFSILKDISDEKLVELMEFINIFLFNDSEINLLANLGDSFFKLLEKKLRGDGELFLAIGNGVVPIDLLKQIREDAGIKFSYHYGENTTDGKSDDLFEQSNIFLYDEQKELYLCNNNIKIIDESVEYGLTLDENYILLNKLTFDDDFGYYSLLEHSNDENKNILFVISCKKYEDIIHTIKVKNKNLIDNKILVLISFNKEDIKGIKNGYKIKSKTKYSTQDNIIFEPSLELLNIINGDLKDYFIDGIYGKLMNDKETDFFKIFYSNENLKLIDIQNIFYSNKDSLEISIELIQKFKKHIEGKSSFLIREYIEAKGTDGKKVEKYIQELFDITILGSYSHILPEVNTHRGPMDFISISKNSYTIIEFKLASNSNIKNNLKFQTETYKKTLEDSSKELNEIKVIFYDNKSDLDKVQKIINKEKLGKDKFYFINYEKNIPGSKGKD